MTSNTYVSNPSGYGVYGICYDSGSGTIFADTRGSFDTAGCTQIAQASGAVLATYSTGGGIALCSDGTNIWSADLIGTQATAISIATGAVVFTVSGIDNQCGSICFDGINIWLASGFGNLFQITAATGILAGTYSLSALYGVTGLCFDGANLWAPLSGVDEVVVFNIATLSIAATYPCGGVVGSFGYPCFDGTYVWVPNALDNTVTKIVASTGSIVGSYAVGLGPSAVAFDGTNLWALNQIDNTVSVLLAATGALLATSAAVLVDAAIICWGGDSGTWVGNGLYSSLVTNFLPLSSGGAAPLGNVAY